MFDIIWHKVSGKIHGHPAGYPCKACDLERQLAEAQESAVRAWHLYNREAKTAGELIRVESERDEAQGKLTRLTDAIERELPHTILRTVSGPAEHNHDTCSRCRIQNPKEEK